MVEIDRASVALFVSRILARIIGFLSVVYFARVLGANGLGIYFTFVTVVSVAGVFSKIGIPGAVVKRFNQTNDYEKRGAYLTAAFVLSIVPFVVTTVILVGLGPRLTQYVGLKATVPLAVLVLGIGSGNRLFVAALRGEGRVATTAWIELLGQIVRVSLSVGLLVDGYGVYALVYGRAAGGASRTLVAAALTDTGFALPSRDAFSSLFSFSKYTAGMNVSTLAYNWTDTLVLAAFAMKAAVGVYETAWMISAITIMTARVIGIALAPAVTRWHESGATTKIERAFSQAITYALVLVLPATAGSLVLGDALLATLYGFNTGQVVLLVLLIGQVAQAVKNVTQNVLFGVNHPEHVFWTNLLSLMANLGLNFALIPAYGMLGAAVATCVTAGVAAVSQILYLRQYITLQVNHRLLGWQVSLTLGMGVLVALLSKVVTPRTLPGLGVLIAVGVGTYGAGLLANEEIRTRLLDTKLW